MICVFFPVVCRVFLANLKILEFVLFVQYLTMLRPKLFLVLLIASGVFGKSLTPKEQVPVFANTIGPFNNPTETYPVGFKVFYVMIMCTTFCTLCFLSIILCRFVRVPEFNENILIQLLTVWPAFARLSLLMSSISWWILSGLSSALMNCP